MSKTEVNIFEALTPEQQFCIKDLDLSDVYLDYLTVSNIRSDLPYLGCTIGLYDTIDDKKTHQKC